MSIFDFFKQGEKPVFKDSPRQHEDLLNVFIEQALAKKIDFKAPVLSELEQYNEIKNKDDDFIKSFIYSCINKLSRTMLTQAQSYNSNGYYISLTLNTLTNQLLRKKIEYSDKELYELADYCVKHLRINMYFLTIPYRPILTKIESKIRENGLSKELREALNLLKNKEEGHTYAEIRNINQEIDYLLEGAPEKTADSSDFLGAAIHQTIDSTADEDMKLSWKELISLLIEVQSKTNPSEKWLREAKDKIHRIGLPLVINKFDEWLEQSCEVLRHIHKNQIYHFQYLTEINHDILKGIIWTCGIINDPNLNIRIDEYGLLALKKLPNVGAISVRTGNACLYCFSMLPFKDGISRLTKFKMKVKYPSVIKQVEKYILMVAKKEGYSRDQLEELSVPDFGIFNGEIRKPFGDHMAVISLKSLDDIQLKWESEGKVQSSVPSKIRNEYKEELNTIKKLIKEINSVIPSQRDRVEQFYLKKIIWNFDEWKMAYIDHPVMGLISQKLIWHFLENENSELGYYLNGQFVNSSGHPVTWLSRKTKVQLWHPIGCSADEVLKWREFLDNIQVKQPFKQAFREVYIVTEAELDTKTYSNRFAAHILKQHQFTALCKQRGWHYSLMGNWDSHNTPHIYIPEWNIRAEFFVDADWDSDDTNGTGVFNLILTDQVRFYKSDEIINMEDVPAMVFTEIMRDVDMFVGVTSIGNDVNWNDNGNQQMVTYWRNYSLSELTETSKIRASALKRLIPRLKIAKQCTIDEKYLIVQGKIRTYKIHIGSGNILMSPNHQYLCIVPNRSANGTEKIFLPFEGDSMLSIIISKALLLADDDKIKDESILSQIKMN